MEGGKANSLKRGNMGLVCGTEKGAFGVLTPISGSEEENDISWSIR
jgi:hypothetical protein